MEQERVTLTPYLSRAEAWALSLGTSIGWGSLVITCSTYLASAGPAGTIGGLLLGGLVMLLIARNYHYLMNAFPDAGGIYTYAQSAFGHDFSFLTAWFVLLTYLAMLWANATSLPLFARYFVGGAFEFGHLYQVFGYEVYLGEALLCIGAIVVAALFCIAFKKGAARAMVLLAVTLAVGIVGCTLASLGGHATQSYAFEPLFVPGTNPSLQVLRIACISPWAFIGFENISHATEEMSFPRRGAFAVLAVSLVSSLALYICVTLLSVTAYPAMFRSWLGYIQNLGHMGGLMGLPAFYATNHYLGQGGVALLSVALFALIVTSLIGNILALSRLLFSLARDHLLPAHFTDLNEQGVPWRAVVLIVFLSLAVPFLGRTAIGWIVDVTTIGATFVYGFVCASTIHVAKSREDRLVLWCGRVGLAVMVVFGLNLLLPSLFINGSIEQESYFLFTFWGMLGFFLFQRLQSHDDESRFGQSVVVSIVLLSLILFTSIAWINQASLESAANMIGSIRAFLRGDAPAWAREMSEDAFIAREMRSFQNVYTFNTVIIVSLFAFALYTWFRSFAKMRMRAVESEVALNNVKSIAYADPLTGVRSKHAYTDRERNLNELIADGLVGSFALVICDINGLKQVNDTRGHKAGDEYIRSASEMICELYAHSPVFRVGGDEFVVILMGGDYEHRQEILDELNRRCEHNIAAGKVVVAAGMSEYRPRMDRSVRDVFERADSRMYARKQELKQMGSVSR